MFQGENKRLGENKENYDEAQICHSIFSSLRISL